MPQDRRSPTALISYSHDSAEHIARVLALANRLRADGVDCDIDQYVAGGTPPEGWPRWMQSRIEHSDFTIMVCSEAYARRVLRQESVDVGRGVIWEANLLYNLLYYDDTFKRRTIPVLLEGGAIAHIPLPFRDGYCDLRTETGYRELLQRLFETPGAPKPELGSAPGLGSTPGLGTTPTLGSAAKAPASGPHAAGAAPLAPSPLAPAHGTAHFDEPLITRLQTQLIEVLGPIGRQIVTSASRRAQSFPALIEELARFGGGFGGVVAMIDRGDLDFLAVAREMFIDGVVEHLGNAMVQRAFVSAADVHSGLFPDRFSGSVFARRLGSGFIDSSAKGTRRVHRPDGQGHRRASRTRGADAKGTLRSALGRDSRAEGSRALSFRISGLEKTRGERVYGCGRVRSLACDAPGAESLDHLGLGAREGGANRCAEDDSGREALWLDPDCDELARRASEQRQRRKQVT